MPTDEQLVARVAAGDEEALRQLLGRYQRRLSHFLHRYTGGRDVEDLYQETWLRVVRGADRFDRERRFSTWLFQIAVNLCRDWHRRPPPEVAAARDQAVDAGLERSEAGLDAQRLLAALDDGQRAVVLLRFFYDLTEAEVADALEIPLGTVKSRTHNALRKLSALVEDER
jgi:RNA polymerase sigma-70 factor (ECF subfamily)